MATVRCPQCARPVEQGAEFCTCGYPSFWKSPPEQPGSESGHDPDDMTRTPGEEAGPRTHPDEPEEATDPSSPTEVLASRLHCPSCGTENPGLRTYCQQCGEDLRPATEEAAPMTAPWTPRRVRPLVVVAGLVLLSAALWFLVFSGGGGGGAEVEATTGPTAAATESSSPSPFPSPTAEPQTQIYVVTQGDTLSSIARRFGTTVEALVEANELANPDVIVLGQQIIIPPPPVAP